MICLEDFVSLRDGSPNDFLGVILHIHHSTDCYIGHEVKLLRAESYRIEVLLFSPVHVLVKFGVVVPLSADVILFFAIHSLEP